MRVLGRCTRMSHAVQLPGCLLSSVTVTLTCIDVDGHTEVSQAFCTMLKHCVDLTWQ